MSNDRTLVTATTDAITSPTFSALNKNNIGIVVADLSVNEIVKVQVLASAASPEAKFIDYLIDGVLQQANNLSPVITLVDDTLTYRLIKPVTINAVGIAISKDIIIGSFV
jgi:hypothetical protein